MGEWGQRQQKGSGAGLDGGRRGVVARDGMWGHGDRMRRRNAVDAGHWPHAIGRERRPPTRRDEGISAGGCGVPLAIGCPAPPPRVAPTPVAVALFSAHARQRRCFYQCHRIHHIQPTPLRLKPVSNSTKLHPNNLREEGSSSLHCTGWFEHVEGQISVVSSSESGFATWTGPAAAVCLCGSQYSSTSRGLMQLL